MSNVKTYLISILVCITLTIGGTWLFRDALLTAWLSNVLNEQTHSQLGLVLSHETLIKTSEGWTIRNAKINRAENQILIPNAQIKYGFFSKLLEIKITNGKMISTNQKEIDFQINGQFDLSSKKFKGKFLLFSNAEKLEVPNLSLIAEATGVYSITCHQLNCAQFSAVFSEFWPAFNRWLVTEGELDGELQLSENQLIGSIDLTNFSFTNESLKLFGKIPQAQIQFQQGMQKIQFLTPASIEFIRNKILLWKFDQLTGEIFFQPNNDLNLLIHTSFHAFEKTVPLKIEASSKAGRQNANAPAFHLNVKMDPSFLQTPSLNADMDLINTPEGLNLLGKLHWGDALDFSLQFETTPLFLENSSWLNWLKNLSHFALKRGDFTATDLSLAPFKKLIPHDEFDIFGKMNLKGVFDPHSLFFTYELQQLNLQNRKWDLEFSSDEALLGEHYLNFSTGHHGGSLPFEQGTLKEKDQNIAFTEISGELHLNQTGLTVTEWEAFCKNIYFGGNLTLINPLLIGEPHRLIVQAKQMSGTLTQLQELITSTNSVSNFLPKHFDGNISLRNEGILFHYAFSPGWHQEHIEIHGAFSDGFWNDTFPNLNFKELSSDFDYDSRDNQLTVSNIQGLALLGSPKQTEEYLIAGDSIKFNQLSTQKIEFDLWIGNRQNDLIHLAGATSPSSIDPTQTDLTLDCAKTSIGGVNPTTSQCRFNSGAGMERAALQMNFSLKTLLQGLKRFKHTGLLFLSKNLIKELSSVSNFDADLQLYLAYDAKNATLSYSLMGDQISVGGQQFSKFLMNGFKKEKNWSIEQCYLDQLNLSSQFVLTESGIAIHFLGISIDNSLLLGLSGNYLIDDNYLSGKINLFEMDMELLKKIPYSEHLPVKLFDKGKIEGKGSFIIAKPVSKPHWAIEGELAFLINDSDLLPEQGDLNFNFSHKKQEILFNFTQQNDPLSVENLSFRKQSHHLQATCLFHYNGLAYTAQFDHSPDQPGECFLKNQRSNDSVVGHWEYEPKSGFSIRDLKGTLSGVTVDLQSRNQSNEFEGITRINLQQSASLLPQPLLNAINHLQMKGEFELQGIWKIPQWHLMGDLCIFSGSLHSEKLEIANHKIDQLFAQININPLQLQMEQFNIKASKCCLKAPKVDLKLNHTKSVEFAIPNAMLTDFSFQEFYSIPLSIRKLEINGFKGIVDQPTSWKAEGEAHCAIALEKHPIMPLNIASEVLEQLGLDFASQHQVSGTAYYAVDNGNIYLTKLKDFHGPNKLSKFSLAKDRTASIDFMGNIQMKIRIKPNQLLFKSSHPLIVDISGSLRDPKCIFSVDKSE